MSTYAELLEGSSTWEGTISRHKTPEELRDINVQATRKRSTLRTSIHTIIPSPIRPGHGKRKERKEGDGWEWKSSTETAAGKKALSSQKSLLGRGNFTKIGKVK
ncbi:unnamed protein product, partial [Prunus brigantina]